jgi:hypothetical protein
MSDAPLLSEAFPELADELRTLLKAQEEEALASEVVGLRIIERCQCGDDFCATMYTVPKPKGAWRSGHNTFDLDAESGTILLDVVHDKIAEIEILNRDEIRNKLNVLIPLVKSV